VLRKLTLAARIEELRKQTEEKLNFAREDLRKFLIDIINAKPEEASANNPPLRDCHEIRSLLELPLQACSS
jgi:hypothetical protein